MDPAVESIETQGTLSEDPQVSLFIPTWNAGPEFPEILERMANQKVDRPYEIVVIDSGSSDGTFEFLQTQKVRLYKIPNSEFNHGKTRNLGSTLCKGEIMLLATQDAKPADEHWMQALVDCYDDPLVMGAYARQLARPDANPFIKDRLSNWAAAKEEPKVQMIRDMEEFEALHPLEKLQRVAFDNVSSSVRTSILQEIPFRERKFGEDLDWGIRAVHAGHKVVFQPNARVIHSHNNSIWYEFKRVYADHQNLHRLLGVHNVPRWRDVWTCGWHATGHLAKVVTRDKELGFLGKLIWYAKCLPLGFSQNLAQFWGARSVRKLDEGAKWYRWLDKRLRKGV
jgi:rhamnosyltransferase